MKFSIQSLELNTLLQTAGKIINPKNPIPIMEYFLFVLEDGKLEITASDQETTQISVISVEQMYEGGSVAVPSRLILDVLKEFTDLLITFSVDEVTKNITISWESGTISIPGQPCDSYPDVKTKNSDKLNRIVMDADRLNSLISTALFATADKDNRITMTGIYFDITPENMTIVGTDGYKLVKISINGTNDIGEHASFILPKKPAINLKALLPKEHGNVQIEFDDKNIYVSMGDNTFICRTIEGRYPNYNGVIPTNNMNNVVVDRLALLAAIKRVSICSDKSSNLVKLQVEGSKIILQAKDLNFYVSAEDSLVCDHNGESIAIGFKYMHMIDMLTTFTSDNIEILLSDQNRAGLFVAVDSDNECEQNCTILLMPIKLN